MKDRDKKERREEFLKKFLSLMCEYRAYIRFNCHEASDTHGLYDERIELCIGNDVVIVEDGWYLEPVCRDANRGSDVKD